MIVHYIFGAVLEYVASVNPGGKEDNMRTVWI
jgi:hypothetical protein